MAGSRTGVAVKTVDGLSEALRPPMTSTDETNSVSPIFTMPWGWCVVNFIGTDAASVQVESLVSACTRSATIGWTFICTAGRRDPA